MIVAWMLYSILVATLLGAAAIAIERASRLAGRSTRWIWIGALIGTVVLPLIARLVRTPGSPGGTAVAPGAIEPATSATLAQVATGWWSAVAVPAALEIPLLLAWSGGSAVVLGALLTAYVRLRRELRRWRHERVENVDVRVSENRGPAAVGFARIELVLPRWVLACTATERRLILLHEMEHRRAGDTRLLAAALAVAVLMPWNPVVWWQLRRLRLATELDCDRRVLQKGADVRAYASLLLNAKLDGLGTRLLTATLFRSKSELGRRIETMTAPQPSHRYLRAGAAAVIGGGVLFAACETPTPSAPEADATAAVEAKPAGDIAFGVIDKLEHGDVLKEIHEVAKTDPDRAAEMKAQFHETYGNVFIAEDGTVTDLVGDGDGDVPHALHEWTTDDGDVPLVRLREMKDQAAFELKQIKEEGLTKEYYFREKAPADEPVEKARLGPTD